MNVYEYLDQLNIDYKKSEHCAIHTIEALEALDLENKAYIPKNLFLRNDNGKQHFVVVMHQDKTVDLKWLRSKIGSSRLSFASEERLKKHLNLSKGSVTPLGIVNNATSDITVVIDEDLKSHPVIGVHPDNNEATLWLGYEDLIKVVECHGNPLIKLKIECQQND